MMKVLVYGLGVSGISTVKTLSELGYEVYTYDRNKTTINELKGYNYSPISDFKITDIPYDFVVKSPGIKPTDDILMKLAEKYEIISDIEASFRLFADKKFLAITGTNGKTSTTSMLTHLLNESGIKAVAVGNIGEGILWQMHTKDAVFVEELSSFQLKHTVNFRPHIGAILNISPDHIDWHGDYEDYKSSKLNITKNQTEKDYLVINKNDEILQARKADIKAKIYEFSSSLEVERGIYLKDGLLILKDDDKEIKLLDVRDLKIIGKHNYENMMAALLMAYLYGTDLEKISEAAKTFKSIAHRLEFVTEIKGVKVYNDSKATNVDSAIKAINSFKEPIINIAGGYDKKIDYTAFIKAFKPHGKVMILMGETKDILKELCEKYEVSYKEVSDMDEAVRLATSLSTAGDIILLAPASASWDMYKSYEDRGEDFKEKIKLYEDVI